MRFNSGFNFKKYFEKFIYSYALFEGLKKNPPPAPPRRGLKPDL